MCNRPKTCSYNIAASLLVFSSNTSNFVLISKIYTLCIQGLDSNYFNVAIGFLNIPILTPNQNNTTRSSVPVHEPTRYYVKEIMSTKNSPFHSLTVSYIDIQKMSHKWKLSNNYLFKVLFALF